MVRLNLGFCLLRDRSGLLGLLNLLLQGNALLLFVFEIFLSLCCVPIYLPLIHFSHSFIADSPALPHLHDAAPDPDKNKFEALPHASLLLGIS